LAHLGGENVHHHLVQVKKDPSPVFGSLHATDRPPHEFGFCFQVPDQGSGLTGSFGRGDDEMVRELGEPNQVKIHHFFRQHLQEKFDDRFHYGFQFDDNAS
jgi:hypothetical protein